ncbi:C-22 sterol desaturase [Ascoidea rubescens DSM 1968]|uniref:C-22 sterol desaturase ERG5 n=1 Tax=Ascoidea rubescens DSM 1968 TaxID=1344418 RepID=A0A1D2VHE9_9ASCO|nr:cytochrome P450 [Ascoidea rubescens DSM 1968]ODV60980.1 cytochrome P450 [Ascoidea rubescens DSM 1968]
MEVASTFISNSSLLINKSISDFSLDKLSLGNFGFSDLKNLNWVSLLITSVIALLIYDQIKYQLNKGSIAGPTFKIWPIIGPFLESFDPKFEEYKAKWDSGPLSCVSIFHKFVIIASKRDIARKILMSPKYVKPCVVDVAVKILRPTNWVFLDGKAHVDYRKGLNGLFTRNALQSYIPAQEFVYDRYLTKFQEITKKNGKYPFFHDFREIMCAVSLKTFCGDYITDDQIRTIADDYYLVTAALELVNFPIILPFTKPWYGRKVADMTMKIFEQCAKLSKENIRSGAIGNCVMDAWVEIMDDQSNTVREFSNREISEAIFTFLFASQDASSSACCWLFQIVADRPDVIQKIREEQLRVRDNDPYKKLSFEMIENMTYTNMVVKETLRFRPPVLMVPYVVKKNYPIDENYTAPKGSMLIPTLYPALHDPEVYEDPEEFIPERWVEGSKASEAKKNWLVFGTGPHVCLGQQYVMMMFTGLIGKAFLFNDIKHHITPLSEEIRVFATIFPKDDCILEFTKRKDPKALE